jgi:hypothetical protein
MLMTTRQERIAENEALFRKVNERVADIVAELSESAAYVDIFCECGDVGCMSKLTTPRSTYEAVRENPRRFLIAAGHIAPDVEVVVERTDAFHVVEKVGEAAEVAEEADSGSESASL